MQSKKSAGLTLAEASRVFDALVRPRPLPSFAHVETQLRRALGPVAPQSEAPNVGRIGCTC